MNDRELLEYAAKAVALTNWQAKTCRAPFRCDSEGVPYWSPLTDDGDALRLAVTLGLLVYVLREIGFTAIRLPDENIGGQFDVTEHHGRDPYAATRRAIVRAAAEIGKGIIQLRPEIDLPEDNYYKTMAEAEEIGRSQS